MLWSLARARFSVPVVLALISLRGQWQSCDGAQHAKCDADLHTSSSLGALKVQYVHYYYAFAAPAGGGPGGGCARMPAGSPALTPPPRGGCW
jgi:hypothetical protein